MSTVDVIASIALIIGALMSRWITTVRSAVMLAATMPAASPIVPVT